MSKLSFDIGTAAAIGGYIAAFVGAILYAFSRQPKQTIQNYKELAESQEKRIADLEAKAEAQHADHIESIKAIADLQGQIKVYKELPLQEMATAMQKISSTNDNILNILQKSAITLAVDTHDAANAVAEVKADLSKKKR